MEICLYFCFQKRIKHENMEQQHGLNNQQQSLLRSHPNITVLRSQVFLST